MSEKRTITGQIKAVKQEEETFLKSLDTEKNQCILTKDFLKTWLEMTEANIQVVQTIRELNNTVERTNKLYKTTLIVMVIVSFILIIILLMKGVNYA